MGEAFRRVATSLRQADSARSAAVLSVRARCTRFASDCRKERVQGPGRARRCKRHVRPRRGPALPGRERGLGPPPEGPQPADDPPARRAGADPRHRAAHRRGMQGVLESMLVNEPRKTRGVPLRARGRPLLRAARRGPLPRQRLQAAPGGLDGLPRDPLRDQDQRGADAPRRGRRPRRRGARRDPAHRHHRLGQVHHARGDDQPDQHARRPSTSSRSRTRSSTCTATSARSSTSARSATTPTPSAARCGGCCARTPT